MTARQSKIQLNIVTGLTPTQEKACSLLASGAKTTDVAQQLDVPEQTSRKGVQRQAQRVRDTGTGLPEQPKIRV